MLSLCLATLRIVYTSCEKGRGGAGFLSTLLYRPGLPHSAFAVWQRGPGAENKSTQRFCLGPFY